MNLCFKVTLAVLAALVLSSGVQADQLLQKKTLSLATAKQIATAAENEAAKNKWAQVIVILDDGGNLLYMERMDDSQLGSIDVAMSKARSALYFKRPTKAFQDAVAQGQMNVLKLPNAIANEGGVPLTVDGKIIGSIGVSGATAAQDGQVAAAGIEVLTKAGQ